MRYLPLIAAGLLATGCMRPAPADDRAGEANVAIPTENVVVPDDEAGGEAPVGNVGADPAPPPGATAYAGRWRGVEGMYLVVMPGKGDKVSLEMQWDLDHKGTFAGTVTPGGIRFTRDGAARTLRRSDGDATGLKYLAGKKDCLTVASGEGYCRD